MKQKAYKMKHLQTSKNRLKRENKTIEMDNL